jgi:hypothetical protein
LKVAIGEARGMPFNEGLTACEAGKREPLRVHSQ